jgi:mannose-6-phosphate isomerase-like protein (cupin superfamily)
MSEAASEQPSARYESEKVAIGRDVRVLIHTFEGERCVPWHWHSEITDTFFCIEGTGRVQLQDPDQEISIAVGQRYDVPAGRKHRISSADGSRCRMILVQGVGEVDFHPAETSQP